MENEDGYQLWLRYKKITDHALCAQYCQQISAIRVEGDSVVLQAAREELQSGLQQLLGCSFTADSSVPPGSGTLVAGTPAGSPLIAALNLSQSLAGLGDEGYLISWQQQKDRQLLIIAALADNGVLYGAFHLLRLLQTGSSLEHLPLVCKPAIRLRLLNHWDNLDGTIERGYAGFSLWDWHRLPGYICPRYRDYARANASIGINGAVLNNVNANALSLSSAYLDKTKVLAEIFHSYGIKVYLAVRFSAPLELGELATCDPCVPEVANWWQQKAAGIYSRIPGFGGFLVKANSEGQPGPQDYGRTHATGANMLAKALEPYGGVVIWRAFVYDYKLREDRAKQAFSEFTPLDGQFAANVLIQVKNGPVDFQPREPFHPLFGAMPATAVIPEFQLTQEYLGMASHLVYLAPLFKECLDADTFTSGENSTVARVADGSLRHNPVTGIAAVANTGSDRNWCGHHFAQANWYAFGRLAWDHTLSAAAIAEEWLRMTFTWDKKFIIPVKAMMLASREAVVDYMTPLGLHHIMAKNHHYGPGPWVTGGRPDWTSPYYHQADAEGIGFDRTAAGSNAVGQYAEPIRDMFGDLYRCPETLLLWFHHLPWSHTMASGRSLWDEICFRYQRGVDSVRMMQAAWAGLAGLIDAQRFDQVASCLKIQEQEAVWWRDACLLYFQSICGLPLPAGIEKPARTLDQLKNREDYFVPGIENPFKGKKSGM